MSQESCDSIAVQALDRVLMTMLERLVRAYGREYVAQLFDPLVPVDRRVVAQRMAELLALEQRSAAHGLGGGLSPMR
jgi:hypothetical protein